MRLKACTSMCNDARCPVFFMKHFCKVPWPILYTPRQKSLYLPAMIISYIMYNWQYMTLFSSGAQMNWPNIMTDVLDRFPRRPKFSRKKKNTLYFYQSSRPSEEWTTTKCTNWSRIQPIQILYSAKDSLICNFWQVHWKWPACPLHFPLMTNFNCCLCCVNYHRYRKVYSELWNLHTESLNLDQRVTNSYSSE